MREKRRLAPFFGGNLLTLALLVLTMVALVRAQSSDADAIRTRLARARALAAAHNLAAAANELDTIRKTTTDDSVRDVARLMLMGICLEEGNYMRAQTLLEEIFSARSAQSESSTEAFFALAGQALKGAREHIERYRSFGINVADKDLPADAINDLDRLRTLLERLADQARQMTVEDEKATAAAALLEDVASLRLMLARNGQERQQWQREMASARQKLSAEEGRMTPVSGTLNSPRAVAARTASNQSAANTTPPNPNTQPVKSAPAQNSSTATNTVAERQKVSQPPAAAPASASERETAATVKPADGKPLNVGSLIEKATQKISPSYPAPAKSARITGVVTVMVEVDPDGTVATVQSTSGPSVLRQAAMEAARRWKFRPTLVDGQPVRVVGFINFNFTL